MTTLLVGTDSLLKLEALKDQDGNEVTSATVEATVYESDGSTEVTGQTWPLTLTHQGQGTYEGVLEDSLNLKAGTPYEVEVVAKVGQTQSTWRERLRAQWRRF